MIDYKNKINSIFRLLEKFSRLLRKCLSFSLADNIFSIAKVVCLSIETDGLYFIYGTKIFWKTTIKYFKKFQLEEGKELTPEYLAAVASKALDEMSAADAYFVLSIPRTWTIVQVAEFPVTVKENLANVMSYELDRLTPLNPENAYYDYKIIDENQDKIKVLLTVANAERINSLLEALRSKNIKIEKLSMSSFVIKKLIKNTYKIKDAIFIAINDKDYEIGAMINDFTVRSISGTMQSPDHEPINKIIGETGPLSDLLEKNGKQARIVVSADENNYRTIFSKLSKFPVLHLNRDNKLVPMKNNKDVSPFALGCFLETITSDQNEFNLLSVKNGKQKNTQFVVPSILLAVIILIGAFYLLAPIFIEQNNIEKIDERINSLKPEMKKIEVLKKDIETLSSGIKTINDFKKSRMMTIDVLKEITRILPDKTWLTRVHIAENSVEIEGYASSATGIISKLENTKYFQKVEFASPTFRDPRQNNERFVIKMDFKKENSQAKKETEKENEKRK